MVDAAPGSHEAAVLFGASAVMQALLDFEAALALARAAEGMIPVTAAQAIAGVCKAELFDVPGVFAAGERGRDVSSALVAKLAETVALFDPDSARHVQAVRLDSALYDTAMLLLQRRALALIDRDLSALTMALLGGAGPDNAAPIAPVLNWATTLLRGQRRLRSIAAGALQLPFDEETGLLGVARPSGSSVVRRIAAQLQLTVASDQGCAPTEDRMSLACEIGVLACTLGRIGREMSLLGPARPSGLPGRGLSASASAGALRAPHCVAALLSAMVHAPDLGCGGWLLELRECASLYTAVHAALKDLARAAVELQPQLHSDGPSREVTAAREKWHALSEQAFGMAQSAPWAAWLPA